MANRQLRLKDGATVPAVNIQEDGEIPQALAQLGIRPPQSVVVLVGGASGIGSLEKASVRKAVGVVARLAQETQSVVIDGGTQAGIMQGIGDQRKQNRFSFPLIGVVFDKLLARKEPEDILDPNHTHFILIPGGDWGDESAWIAKIASALARDRKSITVLVNGGNISRTDVQHSLQENRTTFVMRGTGRMADEITLTGKVVAVDISQAPEKILEFLKTALM